MWTAFRFSILMFLLGGILYPLGITLLSQIVFPYQANGSLISSNDGKVIGSYLIGQGFSRPDYFHPRPSFNHYDASNSGGFNDGPTSKKLVKRVLLEAKQYQLENPMAKMVPMDAVTASASGLDPDISLANAYVQAHRVALARGLDDTTVKAIINQTKHPKPVMGFNEPSVNVLRLNRNLDHYQTNSAKGFLSSDLKSSGLK